MNPDRSFHRGASLEALRHQVPHLPQVLKADLSVGDILLVKTRNSLYHIRAVGSGEYTVAGGWFDRNGKSPLRTTIAGCTWGGSVIKIDVAAACGLCIEFGNRVTTTAVQMIVTIPRAMIN